MARLIKNTYIINISTKSDGEEKTREAIHDVLGGIYSLIGSKSHTFEIKSFVDKKMSMSWMDEVLNAFFKDMTNPESSVYRCYRIPCELDNQENWVYFCENFVIKLRQEFVEAGKYGFINMCDYTIFAAWTYVDGRNFVLKHANVPKEETKGLNLEEMTVFRDTTMNMLPADLTIKYFLFPYYMDLWTNEVEDDLRYTDYSNYIVAVD